MKQNDWRIKSLSRVAIKSPILIVGLPGMANVAKLAVEFITETLDAKKIYDLTSDSFVNPVFINEKNLIEPPKMEIFHKKINAQDMLFLSGDLQPLTEQSLHNFCTAVLELSLNLKAKEIITLGGIGLDEVPVEPKIACAGTDQGIVRKYKPKVQSGYELGPVVGVSGLLVALAKEKKIPAVVLLVETFHNPQYIGLLEARELINHLNSKLNLKISMNELNKEIKNLEKEARDKLTKMIRAQEEFTRKSKEQVSYIG